MRQLPEAAQTLPKPGNDNSVAVLIPCFNEAGAIEKVVRDFRAALPRARIYVYDNNSTDNTSSLAAKAGATVARESRQGKGHVVRRMFADVDASVYVLVDGDDTYDALSAPRLVDLLLSENLDMVNAAREETNQAAYRPGHRFGNRLLTGLVRTLFGDAIDDLLSGYRVFSRRYVKSFPAMSHGFEIETELTVHALELEMPVMEIKTSYRDRAAGTASKLRTFRDGFRILGTIVRLLKEERPLQFFFFWSLGLAAIATVLAIPLFTTYLATGLVPRFPTAILATGLMIISVLSFGCGLILDAVATSRKQVRMLAYLAVPRYRAGEED